MRADVVFILRYNYHYNWNVSQLRQWAMPLPPKWISRIRILGSRLAPPQKWVIICHDHCCHRWHRWWVVKSNESRSMGNYRWRWRGRWQWSIASPQSLCVWACVCVCVFVNNNFWLVFEAHWPTVYGGIALCARIWRQWRQWTTTTIRWEREYDALLLTTTSTPAQTQQLPHTHTHTRICT